MFNALKFSKELEEAGFTKEQAEATINTFYKFMENDFATKAYIKDSIKESLDPIKSELSDIRTQLSEQKSEIKHGLQSLEYRMTIKLGSLLIVGLGVIGTLMKIWLPH